MRVKTNIINRIHLYDKQMYWHLKNGEYIELDEEDTFIMDKIITCYSMNDLYNIILQNVDIKDLNIVQKYVQSFLEDYEEYFYIDGEGENDCFCAISGEYGKCYPENIILSITNKCIQKCIHCFRQANLDGEEMDFDILCKFLDDLYLKVPRIQMTGGEPFLYPHCIEIIERYPRIKFSITTSGNFSSHILERKMPENIEFIQVSLYGIEAYQHDAFTQIKGSFQKTLSNIKKIIKKKIDVIVSFIIMPDNIDILEKMVMFCITLGVRAVKFGKIGKMGRARNLSNVYLNSVQMQEAENKLFELSNKYDGKIIIILGENTCKKKEGELFNCLAGKLNWSVDEKGNIYPCSFFQVPILKIGQLEKGNYKKLICEPRYTESIRNYQYVIKKDIKKYFAQEQIDVKDYCENMNLEDT